MDHLVIIVITISHHLVGLIIVRISIVHILNKSDEDEGPVVVQHRHQLLVHHPLLQPHRILVQHQDLIQYLHHHRQDQAIHQRIVQIENEQMILEQKIRNKK
jgi:hypothetical protein